jgi:hypothetical protein
MELPINKRCRWMRATAGMGTEKLPRASNAAHLSLLIPVLSALIVSCPDWAECGPRRDKVAILTNVG